MKYFPRPWQRIVEGTVTNGSLLINLLFCARTLKIPRRFRDWVEMRECRRSDFNF